MLRGTHRNTILASAVVAVIIALSSCVQVPRKVEPDSGLREFRFEGNLIHPAVVEDLTPPLEVPFPTIVTVDVMAGHKRYRAIGFSQRRGFLYYSDLERHGEGHNGTGFFEYRHIGQTPGGTHVLETASSGGGSGIFMHILLVRIEKDQTYEEGTLRSRVLMRRVGDLVLGDRDDGSIRLEGSRIILSASRYRSEELFFEVN